MRDESYFMSSMQVPDRVMSSLRPGKAEDAQSIGAIFDAAVRASWNSLGELSRMQMFPPEEWDKEVRDHAPPNVLLVATDGAGKVVGFTAVHPRDG
jgi:L-amino acid N-acyltransferase YncA